MPADLWDKHCVELSDDGMALVYTYDITADRTGITGLLADLGKAGIRFKDIETQERSLEDIFVNLVHEEEDDDA